MARRLAWVYIRTRQQPQISLHTTDFQDLRFSAWMLLGLGKKNSHRNQHRKMTTGIRSLYFVRTSGLGIYTHLAAAQNFSTCHQFFLRLSGSAPGCSTFLRPRTWPERLNFFRVTSKIGGLYFVQTSGLNIYKHAMATQFDASSAAKDFDEVHPCFAPALQAGQIFGGALP